MMDKPGAKRNASETRAVHEQLDRMLESDLFALGERQRRFLRYVVKETLAGNAKRLNQFDIAFEVFDRDVSFDPSTDSIVRVEAGRLRSKLVEYYAGIGREDPVLIELPKGGYAVSIQPRSDPALTTASVPKNPAVMPKSALLALLAVVVMVSVYVGFFHPPDHPQTTPPGGELTKPAIAILPFDNMSADPAQEYFSDGMTEDIITDLSILSGLTVIARHSTFVYKNRTISIREVGEDLGVRYVLEGSVRRAGDQLRITAQLIDAATEAHLWAQRYDRDLGDVFAVQDEVTRRIVDALHVTLTALEATRLGHQGTGSVEAHDFYLRGQDQFYRFTTAGVEASIELFSKSIELDPSYAKAHAWKARALVYGYISGINTSKEETIDPALALSRRAVELDRLLPMAHANLAWALRWDKRTDEALSAVTTAIGLDPNFAEAYLWQSLILSTVGKGDLSLAAIEGGMRINPHYGVTYTFAKGRAFFVLGDLQRALGHFERGIARNPYFVPNHVYKLFALERLGRTADFDVAKAELARTNPGFEQSAAYLFYLDELADVRPSD